MGSKNQQFTTDLLDDSKKFVGTISIRVVTIHESQHVTDQKVIVPEAPPNPKPGFVDYLRGGWQISQSIAIDYTASNKPPNDPYSLHFAGPTNMYNAAIGTVGKILEPYDYDKKFPMFGFGGIPVFSGGTKVMHHFALNGNKENP